MVEQSEKYKKQMIQSLETVRTLLGNRITPDSRSTNDQLKDLVFIANQLGLYDAADVVKNLVKD